MAGTATMTEIRQSFRTPLHILVPKLLASRDNWKAKSDRRKRTLKLANLKIRDLSLSRDNWRQRHEQLLHRHRQLQAQLEQLQRERDQARAALDERHDAKKK